MMEAVSKAFLADPGLQMFVAEFGAVQFTADGLRTALTSSPLIATAALAAAFAAGCWLLNILTNYWSWVDRLWSLAPPIYAVVFAAFACFDGGVGVWRVFAVAALQVLWGSRLTFNFARKGGYGHEEDYRWPILRAIFARYGVLGFIAREIFNLSFVAVYQHALIWGFSVLPLYAAWRSRRAVPFGIVDAALVVVALALLTIETVADEQQWAFQSAKYALKPEARAAAGGDIGRGFLTRGLFAYSRHPNFWAEQGIWWTLAAFAAPATSAAVASGSALPTAWGWAWYAAAALLLSLLFQGSTGMTESLTRGKYPAYGAYQRTTSRLMPWFPGPALDSPAGKALVEKALAAAAAAKTAPAAAAAAAAGDKKQQ